MEVDARLQEGEDLGGVGGGGGSVGTIFYTTGTSGQVRYSKLSNILCEYTSQKSDSLRGDHLSFSRLSLVQYL